MNALITRTWEPQNPPQTTNLGLKWKRQMLYFAIHFGDLQDFVDTDALSSAIPEIDQRKIGQVSSKSVHKEGQHPTSKDWWQMERCLEHCRTEIWGRIYWFFLWNCLSRWKTYKSNTWSLNSRTDEDFRGHATSWLDFQFFQCNWKHWVTRKLMSWYQAIWLDGMTTPNRRPLVSKHSRVYADHIVTGIIQPKNTVNANGDFEFCATPVTLTQGHITIHVNNFTDNWFTLRGSL